MNGAEAIGIATISEIDSLDRAEDVHHGVVPLGHGLVEGGVAVRVLSLLETSF